MRRVRAVLLRWGFRPYLGIWLRGFTVEGTEHIPPGPVIYAAMHTSMADTPLIFWAIGARADRTVVTAARDYFFRRDRPGFGALVGLAFGAVPIDRTGPARTSLRDAITWLRSGYSLVVYPQGTIPEDAAGESRLHRGVALLARETGCPVIPVRIEGAASLLPPGVHWPRRAAVHIAFQSPEWYVAGDTTRRFMARIHNAFFFT